MENQVLLEIKKVLLSYMLSSKISLVMVASIHDLIHTNKGEVPGQSGTSPLFVCMNFLAIAQTISNNILDAFQCDLFTIE